MGLKKKKENADFFEVQMENELEELKKKKMIEFLWNFYFPFVFYIYLLKFSYFISVLFSHFLVSLSFFIRIFSLFKNFKTSF